jgi:hypothetical protein
MVSANKIVSIFIVSSFVSIITLAYVGQAYKKSNYPSDVPYGLFIFAIPLLYGIFGIINYGVIQQYGIAYSFVVGALFGLMLSLVGRFVLNLPTRIFNFTKATEYKVHPFAMLLYAGIFQFILTPLTQYVVVK